MLKRTVVEKVIDGKSFTLNTYKNVASRYLTGNSVTTQIYLKKEGDTYTVWLDRYEIGTEELIKTTSKNMAWAEFLIY